MRGAQTQPLVVLRIALRDQERINASCCELSETSHALSRHSRYHICTECSTAAWYAAPGLHKMAVVTVSSWRFATQIRIILLFDFVQGNIV